MSDKINILALAGWLPSRVHPTLGNFVHRHIDAVAQYAQVCVLYIAVDENISEISFEAIENKSYTGRIYYHPPGKAHHAAALYQSLQWIATLDFDVVHAHILHEVFPLLLHPRIRKKPIVLSENWTGYHNGAFENLPRWKRYFMRKAAQNIQTLAPVTPLLMQRMKHFGLGNHFKVIENVVDTSLFYASQVAKKYTFIHVSTLFDPHKNVSGIVRAFAEHVKSQPASSLLIVGDGDTQPYELQAHSLGIPKENITFKGIQSLSEIAHLLRSARYLVLFSNYENFPCVIPEAWSSGIGVISTGVGGIAHYLNHNTGIEVPVQDEKALIQAFEICANESLFDPTFLRKYAEQEFSYQAIAQKFITEFQSLLNA